MNTYVASLPEGVPASARPDSVLRLVQLTQLMRRHLWLILSCAVLAGLGAFIYAHALPKTYTANGLMTVEGEQFAIPELQGALRGGDGPDPMPFVHTEVQALTSRAMISLVSGQMHLQDNPEFNADLRPPPLMKRVKGVIGDFTASFLPKAPPGAPVPTSEDGIIGAVQKSLSVFQDNRSLVISVSFVSQDPALAARFVNLLISDYVASRAQHRADANVGASSIMAQRVDQARADLKAIEQQMQDLRNKGDVVGLRAGSIGQQQVEELTTAAASASLQRSQLEIGYERAVVAARQGSSDALATVLSSPTISALRDQEAQASSRLATLSSQYGANHPNMISARADLAAARRGIRDEAARIVSSLGAQLRIARDQEAEVKQQLDQARHGAVTAENARAQLDQLQEEATTRRNLYQTLLERSQQTMAQPASSVTPDVRVLSPAVAPGFPSGPHVMLAGLMGGAGGGLLGCLIALTRLRGMRGFETAEDVTLSTGLVVLATLPRRLVRREQGVLAIRGIVPAAETDLKAGWDPKAGWDAKAGGTGKGSDSDIEAMRVLRHRLRFAGRREVPRCALFIPEVASDDAPLAAPLAAAFARAAAADGERVLLIEGDLQAPRLGHQLGLEPWSRGRPKAVPIRTDGSGLLAVLAGADWHEAVLADRQPGLDLLLASGRSANAHALLNGVAFQNLLVEARTDYDLVVLHGPPAGTSDAALLVQRADAAIMVIDGRVEQSMAREAASRLRAVARTPLVAVLLARA